MFTEVPPTNRRKATLRHHQFQASIIPVFKPSDLFHGHLFKGMHRHGHQITLWDNYVQDKASTLFIRRPNFYLLATLQKVQRCFVHFYSLVCTFRFVQKKEACATAARKLSLSSMKDKGKLRKAVFSYATKAFVGIKWYN